MNMNELIIDDFNEYIPAEIFIEHTCDTADLLMQILLGNKYDQYIYKGADDEGTCYTDEGQDVFNGVVGTLESLLGKFNIKQARY